MARDESLLDENRSITHSEGQTEGCRGHQSIKPLRSFNVIREAS
jgi:hypothetical protein